MDFKVGDKVIWFEKFQGKITDLTGEVIKINSCGSDYYLVRFRGWTQGHDEMGDPNNLEHFNIPKRHLILFEGERIKKQMTEEEYKNEIDKTFNSMVSIFKNSVLWNDMSYLLFAKSDLKTFIKIMVNYYLKHKTREEREELIKKMIEIIIKE